MERARKIQVRLGGSPSLFDPFLEGPRECGGERIGVSSSKVHLTTKQCCAWPRRGRDNDIWPEGTYTTDETSIAPNARTWTESSHDFDCGIVGAPPPPPLGGTYEPKPTPR